MGRLGTMKSRIAAAFTVAVLAIMTMGAGTVYASQNSLPGQILYPVKIGTEGARLFVAADNAGRIGQHLDNAQARLDEIQALAKSGSSEAMNIAAKGYDGSIGMIMEQMDDSQNSAMDTADLSELVAENILRHLSILDEVYDRVPDDAKTAIAKARESSMKGHENALLALASKDSRKAMKINLAAMEGKLEQARLKAGENDIEKVEEALAQFEEFAKFGEEISAIAQGLGEDITAINDLVAKATSIHLEILAMVYEKVPEEAKGAIERAMENSAKGHEKATQAVEKMGPDKSLFEEGPSAENGPADKIPDGLPVPENLKDKIGPPEGATVPGKGEEIPGKAKEIRDGIRGQIEGGPSARKGR
jgi:hypothetical protein